MVFIIYAFMPSKDSGIQFVGTVPYKDVLEGWGVPYIGRIHTAKT